MNVASMRLPPLPLRKNSVKKLRIDCQQMPLKNKFFTIEDFQKEETNEDQFLQLSNRLEISLSLKRPLSNKLREGPKHKNISCQSKHSSKNTSLDGKKDVNFTLQMPQVSAKSWILYEMKQNKIIYNRRSHKKREIASLTKIMNLISILQLIENLHLNPKNIKVRASKSACSITGTTAELKSTGQYSLYDLFYGMMLPSGNDAAYQIAEIGGFLLKIQRQKSTMDINLIYDIDFLSNSVAEQGISFVNHYLKEMNRMAKKINMYNSNFANPHGLSNIYNLSTAQDMAKLCSYSMKNTEFRKIVKTQLHQYSYSLRLRYKKEQPETSGSEQSIEGDKQNCSPNRLFFNQKKQKTQINGVWSNTNKLLAEGWSGIKTGITPNAGPCLAASVIKHLYGRQYQFLVILLNSQSMQSRWIQVNKLVSWAINCKLYT